jgi:hypothetical protein
LREYYSLTTSVASIRKRIQLGSPTINPMA